MFKRKRNAFTLIELIATLVIMAIIALIVTPLVMNIIRKARISADKRSIDAYGRSIELAISSHLLDTGKFATSIDELTIEYSGNNVECETTQINSDSSVYLSNCKVNNREVTNYTYGNDKSPTYEAYSVGDEVTYNNVDYYVIKGSDASEDTVTMLKAEPLSYEEIATYSAGTGAQNSNLNGYGGMQYHSDSSVYSTSYVKTTVDAWVADKVPSGLQEARLITIDDLKDNLGYELDTSATSEYYIPSEQTPSWVYISNYWYWSMNQHHDSTSDVLSIRSDGRLCYQSVSVYNRGGSVVRPVITISKSALQ